MHELIKNDLSLETSKFVAALSAHFPYCEAGWGEIARRIESGESKESSVRNLRDTRLQERIDEKPGVVSATEQAIEWCEKNDVRMTYPGAGDYPKRFLELHQPPRFISYVGTPAWLQKDGLSVVGSRELARNTLLWMEEHLQTLLRTEDIFVSSGGARGVDQAAHRIAIRSGRATLAFLPSGLGDIYPKDFKSWFDEIKAGGGAVISEYPPTAEMRRENFQRRNRMIAAIGSHLFIAQAGRKSGTMITARQAVELHRPIAVLPASPIEMKSLGGLDLLFDGAQLVRDHRDLKQFLEM